MKVLVTGGTVFVSKYIAQYLLDEGNDVYVLNRNTKPQVDGVKLIECDRNKINGRLNGIHFDAVIDVTAYNADDIYALADALDSFDSYIMISSSAVYPETLSLPFKETDRCGRNRFWGDYGTNKIAAEKALEKIAPHAYIIRPPYLYGEYNNVYREAFVFDCVERESPFYLPKDGSMPLQFFHVEDLCRFIETVLRVQPEQRIYNVGNVPISVREWVKACYRAVGAEASFIEVQGDIDQRKYFPFYDYVYALDTTAQNRLMQDLLPLDEGLRRAYEWYKHNREKVIKKNYLDFIQETLI